MDDYDDWDYDDYIEALSAAAVESWSPAMLAEVTAATTPSLTALFRRDRETLWINAYQQTRLITETFPPITFGTGDVTPGLIREVHVGKRANIVDAFYSLTGHAVEHGWQRVPCIYADSGDPWDVKSVYDTEREMPF